VLKVLLRKAESIRKSLGVSVPVPADSNKVLEAIFTSLLSSGGQGRQLGFEFDEVSRQLDLFAGTESLAAMDLEWNEAAEQEKRSRTVFAQHALKPEQVRAEIRQAADALGDHQAVEAFVRRALDRLGAPLAPAAGKPRPGFPTVWRLDPAHLPEAVQGQAGLSGAVKLAFYLPVPEGVIHLARTHPLVEGLGSYLGGQALDGTQNAIAARCGAIRTRAVETRTHLILLRLRIHLEIKQRDRTTPLLAEECVVAAFKGRPANPQWLPTGDAEALLAAEPAANVVPEQGKIWLDEVLRDLARLDEGIDRLAQQRADEVLAAHTRVRDAARMTGVRYTVKPQLPADLLGVYVLMPALS